MQSKKKIAIFTTDEGHKSIAEAITQHLEKKYDVVVLHHRDPSLQLYLPFYQLFPNLFKYPFQLGQHAKLTPLLTKIFRSKVTTLVNDFYHTHQPDLMINTYLMFSPVLEDIQAENKIPFINIITDPKTIHPLVISPGAVANFAFDESQLVLCQKIYNSATYLPAGWFVRDQFEQPYDKIEVRKKLRLHQNKLTFLVASGSEGTTLVMKILGLLLEPNEDLQLIIACGNNKTLYKGIKLLARMIKKTGNKTRIVPLKFTTQLHQYMQAADLIVGKAGPNTLFEAIATHTPFFAITHIAGQEDGNLEIIRDYKIGYVEERPMQATKILQRIIDKPKELEAFTPYIKTLAAYNHAAKKILLQKVAELL